MIHLYSGDGRGKTSIAIGTAVRMAGAGKKVIFAQFMKGNESSEINVLKGISGVEICRVPETFPFYKQMSGEEKEQITKYHNEILMYVLKQIECRRKMEKETKEPDLLIVLDEITYPVRWGLVDGTLVTRLLLNLPENVELVMTGRNPSDEMVNASDYWSELSMKRHPYEKGILSRRGVEF